MLVKVVLCSGDQSSALFFSMFFSSGRRAAAVRANFCIYRVRWCMEPIKLFSCLKVFGGDSFSKASVLLIRVLVPRY